MTPSTKDTVGCATEVKQPIVPGEGLRFEIEKSKTKHIYKSMTWEEIQQRGREIFKAQDKDRNEKLFTDK